jgi:hypothetical protein
VASVKHNAPFAAVDKGEEQRKQELHNAVAGHVKKGNLKAAHDAGYKVAHAHALADRHGPDAAHEIATRKAKTAVKRAQSM